MSRLIIASVAAIAAAGLAPQAPVMAHNDARADSTIVVSAPTVRQMDQADRKSTKPQQVLISQTSVYTGDLDLRTQYGRDALDSRVQAAAEQSCDRLDQIDPPSALSGGNYSDCVFSAVQHAQNQVYAAIWSA